MGDTDPADVLRQIGRNIKAKRTRREMTQEALAYASGMAVAQVARMERGESDTGVSKYVLVGRAPFDHAVVRAYRWPAEELHTALEAAGFEVIETRRRTERGRRPVGAILCERRHA